MVRIATRPPSGHSGAMLVETVPLTQLRVRLGSASPTLRNPLPHWGRGEGEGVSIAEGALIAGAGLARMLGQGLAEGPDRAGDAMAVGNHRIEGALDPVAIAIGDHQRGQQLHRMIGVPRDLNEDLVI